MNANVPGANRVQPLCESRALAAAEAILSQICGSLPACYFGPEGDYLRLTQEIPRKVDASISCAGLPNGRYSMQICLHGDPLDIPFDDECDLRTLASVCAAYFSHNSIG